MIRFFVCLVALTASCFATGSRQTLVAEMNGWTLTLDSSFGAQIEKSVGDRKLVARIPGRKFINFWDYFYLAKTLPQTAKNQKSPFQIVVRDFVGNYEHPQPRVTVTYLAPETARPVFELMLLNYRADLVGEFESVTDQEAKLVEEELNKNPPIDRRLILPNNGFVFKVSGKKPPADPEPWLRETYPTEQGGPFDDVEPSK
jgi:hypothetical protein